MIRAVIADDHPVVRTGLKRILSREPDIQVVAEAATGREVLDIVRAKAIDILVLDIVMPNGNGLEVLRALRREQRTLPVLVLSMHTEGQYGWLALKAGAQGYLTKEEAADQLVSAVRKVVVGRKYISEALHERLAFEGDLDPERPLHERLSDREFEVFRLIARGYTVGEIAGMLKLSHKTISTYRARILEKLRLDSNIAIVRYAAKEGLLEPGPISAGA